MIRSKNNLKSSLHRRAGVSMVEMALCAPIFFMVLFAGLEFSRVCLIRNAANNAAYQAARQIIVPGATVAQAQSEASRLLGVLGVRVFTLTVNPTPITATTTQVTVSISIPAKENGWVSAVFSKNLTIKAGSTLFTERESRL